MLLLARGLPFLGLLFLAACSTPSSRIAGHQALFDRFPPEVREKIAAGRVDLGFTPEMVRLALGEPDRRFTRKTDSGEADVWGYHDHRPQFSIGIGVGGGSRHSAIGGGVEMSTGGNDPEETIRVEFRAGVVSAIDYLKR